MDTDNYLISSLHGFILRDTSDMDDLSKNSMITIPQNINLVTYADFCSKACNTTRNMQQYICNSGNFVGAIDGPNKIYGPDSIIPEIYLADEPNQSTIIKSCNDKTALGLYKLSNLLKETFETPLVNPTNIHLLVCLDVFDISNMENKDNIETIFDLKLLNKLWKNNFMLDCNESALKINRMDPLTNNIILEPNTIIAHMSGVKQKLKLNFKDNIKSEDKYGIYPAIIRQLNVLFNVHNKEKNKVFINWLQQNYLISTNYSDDLDSKTTSISDLIIKIGNAIKLDKLDKKIYDKILPEIEINISENTITIDMSEIDISNKDNACIITKYLFKILNNKITNERKNIKKYNHLS